MHMRLSKLSYYADFVVYPSLILLLSAGTLYVLALPQRLEWFLAVAAGAASWTLLEYVLHRAILHRVRFFNRMHDAHHENPNSLVGTPTWLTATLGALALLPVSVFSELSLASGLSVGLMLGYLWYAALHHALHHHRIGPSSFFYRAKLHHAQHHHGRGHCNFGVTTVLWDRVFGSAASSPR